jgi:hypothetical protein
LKFCHTLQGNARNSVTALTTTMADVSAGKTANTHMYAKSVAGVILRDSADNEQIQQLGHIFQNKY